MSDNPFEGDVWRYSYLWRWQNEHGETEGRKERPVSFVAIATSRSDKTVLFILPITSEQPKKNKISIEIPRTEIHRVGLDAEKRLWVILDEYNLDILERSYYFDTNSKIGSFSSAFRLIVLKAFRKCYLAKRAKSVRRYD